MRIRVIRPRTPRRAIIMKDISTVVVLLASSVALGRKTTADCRHADTQLSHFCLSNATHSIGQNIKSLACPLSVRPAFVDKIETSIMDRSSPNFGTQLPSTIQKNIFWAIRSEVACAHARPLMDCHLQPDVTWPQKVKVVTPKCVRLYMSLTLQDRHMA